MSDQLLECRAAQTRMRLALRAIAIDLLANVADRQASASAVKLSAESLEVIQAAIGEDRALSWFEGQKKRAAANGLRQFALAHLNQSGIEHLFRLANASARTLLTEAAALEDQWQN